MSELDLLTLLERDADLTPHRTLERDAWLHAIARQVVEGDGTWYANQIRERVPQEYRHTPRAGTTTSMLVKRGFARRTGGHGTLGNTEHRAGSRLVHVYELTDAGRDFLKSTLGESALCTHNITELGRCAACGEERQ